MSVVSPVNGTFPRQISSPPRNLGTQRFKSISKDSILKKMGNLKNTWQNATPTERGLYQIAALCLLIAAILLIVTFCSGGLLALAQVLSHLTIIAVMGICIGRRAYSCHTEPRLPWQMPAFSDMVKGDEGSEQEWRHLWEMRNQAKQSYENVLAQENEEYAEVLLHKYEEAELRFCEFADLDSV